MENQSQINIFITPKTDDFSLNQSRIQGIRNENILLVEPSFIDSSFYASIEKSNSRILEQNTTDNFPKQEKIIQDIYAFAMQAQNYNFSEVHNNPLEHDNQNLRRKQKENSRILEQNTTDNFPKQEKIIQDNFSSDLKARKSNFSEVHNNSFEHNNQNLHKNWKANAIKNFMNRFLKHLKKLIETCNQIDKKTKSNVIDNMKKKIRTGNQKLQHLQSMLTYKNKNDTSGKIQKIILQFCSQFCRNYKNIVESKQTRFKDKKNNPEIVKDVQKIIDQIISQK